MEIYLPCPTLNLSGSEIYLPPSEIYPEYLKINRQRLQKPSQ
jgi:hypothetical protein